MNSFDHIAESLAGHHRQTDAFVLAALLLSSRVAARQQPAAAEVTDDDGDEEDADPRWAARFRSLTLREREVLQGVVDDKKNKQIADRLGVSRKTVDFHRANLMDKLRARSVVRLVKMAVAEGAVPLEATDAARQAWQVRMQRLHPREREVLRDIVAEKSSHEIAQQLGISRKTVDFHRANLMRKLQARSVVHLVKMAVGGCVA